MDLKTLEKANALNYKIHKLKCFKSSIYHQKNPNSDNEAEFDFNNHRNPEIILKYDISNGQRSEIALPIIPSDKILKVLFDESDKELRKAISELESL